MKRFLFRVMTGNTSISLGLKFLWNFLLSLSALVVLAWALAALPCHLLGATLCLGVTMSQRKGHTLQKGKIFRGRMVSFCAFLRQSPYSEAFHTVATFSLWPPRTTCGSSHFHTVTCCACCSL